MWEDWLREKLLLEVNWWSGEGSAGKVGGWIYLGSCMFCHDSRTPNLLYKPHWRLAWLKLEWLRLLNLQELDNWRRLQQSGWECLNSRPSHQQTANCFVWREALDVDNGYNGICASTRLHPSANMPPMATSPTSKAQPPHRHGSLVWLSFNPKLTRSRSKRPTAMEMRFKTTASTWRDRADSTYRSHSCERC